MNTQTQTAHFAYGYGSLSSKIIREYANGIADGFLNDLASGHVKPEPDSENALIQLFIGYVSKQA